MKNVSKLERNVLLASISVMATFMALMAIAAWRFGVEMPGCVTEVQPFDVGKVIKRSDYDYEIHMIAKMWSFDPAEINLPKGSKVRIYLSAKDVTHGFHIEKTNVNLMAVPGAVNYAEATLNEVGPLRIVCHEYCGSGHQNMIGVINVVEGIPTDVVPVQAISGGSSKGKELVQTYGCVACHTTDGSKGVGPTFKGLLGRTEEFVDGSTQVVDEAFIEEYIKNPNFKVIKGFQPAMPKLPVKDDDIKEMINYIKTIN